MLEIIIAIPIVLLTAFGGILLANPDRALRFMFERDYDEQPEMPENLRRMTEIADEAIAARAAGRELPREIDEYR